MTLLGGRYRLGEALGSGGMGTVLAGWDTFQADRPVAIKLVKHDAEGALLRDFALAFGLEHPHVARVTDCGRLRPGAVPGLGADGAYVVMELCPGPTALAWAKQRPTEDILELGAQLAWALAGLHGLGIRHGDLKPDNVVVVSEAPLHAKLIDFGLASRGQASGVSGTLGYLAPEAMAGRAALASDVFALGVTLVHLLSGAAPRPGEPLSVPSHADVLSPLLEADPARRADAATAFDLLSRALPALRRERLASRAAADQGPGFFGREAELGRVALALDTSRGAGVLRMAGPAGSGKTALLGQAALLCLAQSREVPGLVRSGRSGELELVEQLLRELGSSFPPAQAAATPEASRWRRLSELAEALGRAAARHKLAVIFDDVPQGSPLDALGVFLARLGARGPHLTWLAALRPGPADGPSPDLVLEPLDVAAVSKLIRAARPLRPRDADTAAFVHQVSGGNAACVVAALLHWPAEALRAAAKDGTRPALDLIEERARAASEPLPAACKHAVGVLAQLEAPVGAALLERLLGAAAPRAREGVAALLEPARLAGLCTVSQSADGPLFAIGGEVTRRALRARAPGELKAGLAAALAAEDRPEDRHPETQGRLLMELGQAARARPLLIEAAQAAAGAHRPAEALGLYDQILADKSAAGPELDEARVASARLLLALGKPEEAAERFAQTRGHAAARLGRAEALVALGRYADAAALLEGQGPAGEDAPAVDALAARAALLAGDYDAALARVERALRRDAEHPRAPELLGVQGLVAFYKGELPAAQRLLSEALAAAQSKDDRRAADGLRANLALALHKAGDLAGAERTYEEALELARRAGDLPRQALRLSNLATVRQERGNLASALAAYEEAHELANLVEGKREAVRVRVNWANLLAWLGDHAEAERLVAAAGADAERLGMGPEQAYLALVGAEVAVARGDRAGARAQLDKARERFAAAKATVGLIEANAVLAELYLYERDLKRAQELARACARRALEAGRERIRAHALLWELLALADDPTADTDGVRRAAQALADLAAHLDDPDLGWLAHGVASHREERAGRQVDAELHLAKARQLASLCRARISSRYEKSYGEVWYRREAWARLARGTAPGVPEQGKSLDRVLAINRELAQDHDPERLLERIIDAAIALSGAERGFIVLKTDDQLAIHAARNIDQATLPKEEAELSRSITIEAISRGLPVSSIDAKDDERFKSYRSVHQMNLRSVLCLPLRSHAGVLGALYLDHRHRIDAFSAADVALLTTFGDQAAIALANARRVKDLAQRTSELEASRRAIEELNVRLAKELEARSAELEVARASAGAEAGESLRFGMVGKCVPMQRVFKVIERVADKEVPVNIHGESGTGKELVARAIHSQSPRAGGAFVSVNCGAIPKELLESELFGHEKGAFTGAVRAKPGLFEIARGGTLFLDEIGDMPPAMQVKLLRVLQQKEFRRVGGTQDLTTDARVISASNKDLAVLVRDGAFREDLWYRLNVVELTVPPLRTRREDLPLLIEHLSRRHAGKQPPKLTREALAVLLDYDWPGNVRELENELLRAMALSDGRIDAADLSPKLRTRASGRSAAAGSLREAVELFERKTLEVALEENGGKVTAAARALGLTRAGLYKKLHKYGLYVDKS